MTETDLGRSVASLPEAVLHALAESRYSTWKVDDLDRYERLNDTFYLVEVEMAGQRDRDLFFAPDGTLLLDEEDGYGTEVTPNKEF